MPSSIHAVDLKAEIRAEVWAALSEFMATSTDRLLLEIQRMMETYRQPPPSLPSHASAINTQPALGMYCPSTPDIFSPPHHSSLLDTPPHFPPLPDPSNPGPSWAAPQMPSPQPPPTHPLQSPSRHTLKPPSLIIERLAHKIIPGSVGWVAITLAQEAVFGPDVMARGALTEEGMMFIKKLLR